MSTITYGPALDSEIGYRREGLLRDAAATRLARIARRARRADRHADAVASVRTPATVTGEAATPAVEATTPAVEATAPAVETTAPAVEVAVPATVGSETRVVRAA